MRRTLLVAAVVAALSAPGHPAGACDFTKLKSDLTDCAEFWHQAPLFFMNGLCDMGYLGICYIIS